MVVTQQKRGIGTFSNQQDVEAAINTLKDAGFPLDKISVIGKGLEKTEETPSELNVSNKVNDAKVESSTGIVNDALALSATGFTLVGLQGLVLPFIGPVLAAGSLAAALGVTVASTGVAAMAAKNLINALEDLGLNESTAKDYSDRLQAGEILVMVEGSEAEIKQAENAFLNQKIQGWGIY